MMHPSQIRAAYEHGTSLRKLSQMSGRPLGQVRALLQEQGVQIRRSGFAARSWNLSPESAHKRYARGEDSLHIARDAGVSRQTMLAEFHRRGWPVRTHTTVVRESAESRRVPTNPAQIRSLYESGMSIQRVAEATNLTYKIVRARLLEQGVELRGRGRSAERNHFWAGGYHVDRAGYILVRLPEHPDATSNGYVRAHRVVAAQMLGRPLLRVEVVDHRDGDTSNNHPDNLQVFPDNGHHLRATKTGSHKLRREQREGRTRQAVLRARQRVDATLAALEADAGWSHVAWPRPSSAPRTAQLRP